MKNTVRQYTIMTAVRPGMRIGLVLLLCWSLLSAVSPAAGQLAPLSPHDLVPEQRIEPQGQPVPAWKTLWDNARKKALAGEYEAAVESYRQLLTIKNNLDEARWELVRIFIHRRRWQEAAGILELLLEKEPERLEYLTAFGRVMWETNRYERAVSLFGRAYRQQPENQIALAGLIEGLIKLDRKQEALPLLEQFLSRQPANIGVRRYLALFAYELGQYEKARPHLVALASQADADREILKRAAQVHERLGLGNLAVEYWRKILARNEGDLEAHRRLAAYYEKNNQPGQALHHLLVIAEHGGAEDDYLARIGRAYAQSGNAGKALNYFRRHLASHPRDHEILREVIRLEAALGHREKTLSALDRYFTVEPESDAEQLRMAARMYDAAGRYHEAIPLYRRLSELTPEDPDILAALADDLLAIGENEGALSLWKQLAKVVPDKLEVYRAMADLLRRLGRRADLLEVLYRIHLLDPDDETTMLELAELNLRRGEEERAAGYLEKLAAAGNRSARFLELRAGLSERRRRIASALADYQALLARRPDRREIRIRIVELAGVLGLMKPVFDQLEYLAENPAAKESAAEKSPGFLYLQADIFRRAGFYQKALAVLDRLELPARPAGPAAVRPWLERAAVLRAADRYYEAEQILREAVGAGGAFPPVVRQLFDYAIEDGRLEDCAAWLDVLRDAEGAGDIGILEARLLAARGEFREALRLGGRLLRALGDGIEDDVPAHAGDSLEVRKFFARLLLDAGRESRAEELADELLNLYPESLFPRVYRQQVYQRTGETVKAQEILSELLAGTDGEPAAMFELAELYRSFQDDMSLAAVARAAGRTAPVSLRSRFLLASAGEAGGKLSEALTIMEEILAQYPDNSRARTGAARLLFRLGRLPEALGRCRDILSEQPGRPDILLLKARVLWAMNRWPEAVEVYERYLQPPVEELLAGQLTAMDIAVKRRPRRTLWNRLTFTSGRPPALVEVIMTPVYLVAPPQGNGRAAQAAASLYARYRWQQRFAGELAARQAIQRREYYLAARLYESLLQERPDDEPLMFDLAGIYSRLGRLGREALLYERLQTVNPDFPGLAEAGQRNRLKRRPTVTLQYGRREEEGWDNYQALAREWSRLGFWLSPRARHELEFSVERLRYEATDDSGVMNGYQAGMSYAAALSDALSLSVGAGVHGLEEDGPTTGLFSGRLDGDLGDIASGRLSYSRRVTEATLASLNRNIVRDCFSAGLLFDIMPRLQVGSDYAYSDYSDDNRRNRYSFWSSYILFQEPTHLEFTYRYDYLDAHEGSLAGSPLPDGFAADDHPYWSPRNYWLNSFTVAFRHQLSADTLARGIPRYYTVEYTVGYDSRDYDLQAFRASINLELNRHLILQAAAGVTSQKNFQGNEVTASLVYRW